MNVIQAGLRENRTSYNPADTLSGAIRWESDEEVRAVEVRLIWFTRGKGTGDVGLVAAETWDHPGKSGVQSFSFTLPEEPWSFTGRLITLTWAVEAVLLPSKLSDRVEFVMARGGKPLSLQRGGEEHAKP
jgi:hypothetical protein